MYLLIKIKNDEYQGSDSFFRTFFTDDAGLISKHLKTGNFRCFKLDRLTEIKSIDITHTDIPAEAETVSN